MAIPLPYIDQTKLLNNATSMFDLSGPGLAAVSARASQKIGLFTLGITPSINASIILQLAFVINPNLKKLQREEGESGRRKLIKYTRYLTLLLAITQSVFLIFSLRAFIFEWSILKLFELSCVLSSGAMIILWISECITKTGITNGSSFLIFLNIVSVLPEQIGMSFKNLDIFSFEGLIVILTFSITVWAAIFLQQTLYIIPLKNPKLGQNELTKKLVEDSLYLPFRLNQAGVMPVVFASYLIPILKTGGIYILLKINSFNLFPFLIKFPEVVNQSLESIVEAGLICLFALFYSGLIIDPKDVADELQKSGFFIFAIRPGEKTRNYLEKIFKELSLIGALILAFNVVLLNLVGFVFNLSIFKGFSIGSQIILLGVVTEILQKVQALVLNDVYKRIRDRNK